LIVVDTNVLAGVYFNGAHTGEIEAVTAKDPEWIAPYLWRYEFRNVLALYCRKKLLSLSEASLIALRAEIRMRNREYWAASGRVLEFAERSGCTAYDCEFVSVASDLEVPLVTLDKKVLRAFPSLAVSPADFVSRG
jgi:predicted nucleic acid-binding protein